MALTPLTNTFATKAGAGIRDAQARSEQAGTRIALGTRIVRASDDASSASVHNILESDRGAIGKAIDNMSQGSALLQVATGGIKELVSILNRARELAVQASSELLGADERSYLDLELQQLLIQFDDITNQTNFLSSELLSSGTTVVTANPVNAAATFTRDTGQVLASNTFTGALNTTLTTGAITGAVIEASAVANTTQGFDYTLKLDTGDGFQTFTATAEVATAGQNLVLTSAQGNAIAFAYNATSVVGLDTAANADASFKQLVSLTPDSTAASFVSKNDGFTASGFAEADPESAVANGGWTLLFDSAVGTRTLQGVTAEAILNAGAADADGFAATVNAASTGAFTGTWTSSSVVLTGPNTFDVSITVEDDHSNSQTFSVVGANVADGGTLTLTSTSNAGNAIVLDYGANALTGAEMATQQGFLTKLEALRTGAGAGQQASFTSASVGYVPVAGLASVTTTDPMTDARYTLTYTGTSTAGAGNENFVLQDATGQTVGVQRTLSAGELAAPDDAVIDYDLGDGKTLTIVLGSTFTVDQDFQFGWDSSGSNPEGHTIHADDGRGNRISKTGVTPTADGVEIVGNFSVQYGSNFDATTDKLVTFGVAQQNSFTFQSGARSTDTITTLIDTTGTANLNLTGVNVLTIDSAATTQEKVAVALRSVNSIYATLGAQQARLGIAKQNTETIDENLQDADSTFYDAKMELELTNRALADFNYRTGIAMLAAANEQTEALLRAV